MNTVTVVITETGTPSRSKGRGWAKIGDTFATATGREILASEGERLQLRVGVELRRASGRIDKTTDDTYLIATGKADDTATISLGSPQAYTVQVSGVRYATEDDLQTTSWTTETVTGRTLEFHNAYPVRAEIKAAGGTWDGDRKVWELVVEDTERAAALANVAERSGCTVRAI